MKTFPITLAFALALTAFQVQPVRAANLSASLHVGSSVTADNNTVYTRADWGPTNSSASTLGYSAALEHGQAMTSATFGELSMDFSLDGFTPDDHSGFGADATVDASWSDTVTINSATLDGTQGYLRPAIRYSGTVFAMCDADTVDESGVNINFRISQAVNPFSSAQVGQIFWVYPTNSPQTVNLNFDTAEVAASSGLSNLDIPFTYGQPFGIAAELSQNGAFSDIDGPYFSANARSYLKLQWLGAQVLDANANPVSDFTLTSDSGKDWTVSQAIVGAALQIGSLNVLNGTNLVINGTNGTPFNPVFLLTSTNLTLPMANWMHLDTNSFDFIGNVSFTNATRSGEPHRYYRLLSQ
jgi:hypothetical protein